MRKYIGLFLIAILLFGTVRLVRASPNNPDVTDIVNESRKKQDSGSMLTRIIAKPIESLATAIFNIAGFQSIDKLVFDTDSSGFTNDEWNKVVNPWYKMTQALVLTKGVIGLVVTMIGYSQIFSSFSSPLKRAQSRETVASILVVLLLITSVPSLLDMLLEFNNALVKSIKNLASSSGVKFGNVIGEQFISSLDQDISNVLMRALVKMAFAGLTLYLNFIYMVRKFMLIILVITIPLIAWSWVSTRTRTPVKIALSELVTNAIMPASHALVLCLYMMMVKAGGEGTFSTWWAKLFAITLIVPLGAFLRNLAAGWLDLLGFQEELSGRHALTGVSSLMAIGTAMLTPRGDVSKRFSQKLSSSTSEPSAPKHTRPLMPQTTIQSGIQSGMTGRTGPVMSNRPTGQNIAEKPGKSGSVNTLPPNISPGGVPVVGQHTNIPTVPSFEGARQQPEVATATPISKKPIKPTPTAGNPALGADQPTMASSLPEKVHQQPGVAPTPTPEDSNELTQEMDPYSALPPQVLKTTESDLLPNTADDEKEKASFNTRAAIQWAGKTAVNVLDGTSAFAGAALAASFGLAIPGNNTASLVKAGSSLGRKASDGTCALIAQTCQTTHKLIQKRSDKGGSKLESGWVES